MRDDRDGFPRSLEGRVIFCPTNNVPRRQQQIDNKEINGDTQLDIQFIRTLNDE